MRYGRHLLIALDQLGNAILAGWPDETISARAWRCRDRAPWGLVVRVVNGVFFWQSNHCRGAAAQEQERRHAPIELRT